MWVAWHFDIIFNCCFYGTFFLLIITWSSKCVKEHNCKKTYSYTFQALIVSHDFFLIKAMFEKWYVLNHLAQRDMLMGLEYCIWNLLLDIFSGLCCRCCWSLPSTEHEIVFTMSLWAFILNQLHKWLYKIVCHYSPYRNDCMRLFAVFLLTEMIVWDCLPLFSLQK